MHGEEGRADEGAQQLCLECAGRECTFMMESCSFWRDSENAIEICICVFSSTLRINTLIVRGREHELGQTVSNTGMRWLLLENS